MTRPEIEALLARAVAAGVELWREGGELRFRAPKGALAADLREALRTSKEDLLACMQEGERHLFTSDGQRRVWLADRMEPGSPAYNIPMAAVRLRGALDGGALREAIEALLARHEALRARFPAMGAEPVQVIAPAAAARLRSIDLTTVPASEREAAAWRAVRDDVQRPFDVTTGPLIRTTLVALGEREHWLVVTMHHVAADVWSMQVFLRDLVAAYGARVDGRAPTLAPLPAGFRDLFHARRAAQASALEEGLRYWRQALDGAPPRVDLPLDRPRPERRGVAGDHEELVLDASTWAAVREYARTREATPFMVLFAAFAEWLSRHAGQDDILAGCPVWGRPDAESQGVVGLFADTLPLRLSTAGDPSFDALVARACAATLEAYRHESVPLARILESVRAGRTGEGPVLSVLFDVLAFGTELRATAGGLEVESLPLERGATDVDLFFIVSPEGDGLRLWLEYARDVFDAATVRAMVQRFERLLSAVLKAPGVPLSTIVAAAPADERVSLDLGARAETRARAARLLDLPDVERVAIVDARGAAVPPGVTGEVVGVVGGETHALDRLGRFGADGALEIHGRRSRAVRVRGTRIDADAMEALLRTDPSVVDAAVVCAGGDAPLLVAFVVTRGSAPLERMAARVRAQSPHGLAPAAIVPVTRLPRTSAGAVDEEALLSLPAIGEGQIEAARQLLSERAGAPIDVTLEPPRAAAERVHVDDVSGAPSHAPAPRSVETEEVAAEASGDGPPALADGGPSIRGHEDPTTLGAALAEAARATPEREIVFVSGRSTSRTSYAELLDRACAAGGGLRAAGCASGLLVLLLDEPAEILGAFWAAVVAGVSPLVVPLTADGLDGERAERLRALHDSLGRPPVLTSARRSPAVRDALVGAEVRALEALVEGPRLVAPVAVDPSATAFLTLTSGSTGVPKAVQLTHRGVLARARGTNRRAGFAGSDVVLNWLPLDHIGSLSDWHVRPLLLGSAMVYARKEDVLGDPLRWLELLETHRVTHGWAPNFAFALVAEALAQAPARRFDLTSVRGLLTAGEAISPSVVATFLARLAPFGLRDDVILPAFGMAELGSGVTYAERRRGAVATLERAGGAPLVDLGPPIPGVALRIVDAAGRLRAEGVPGRLQVKGEPVFAGYANAPAEAERVRGADGWFDTGDLGVIVGGRLGLTGRAKETLVIRGGNYPCAEVEAAAQVEGVRPAHVAACAVAGPDGEQLAIAFVPDPAHAAAPAMMATVRRMRESLARRIGLAPDRIVPLAAEDLPRTSLGKIRRGVLTQAIVSGRFAAAERALDLGEGNERALPRFAHRRVFAPRPGVAMLPAVGTRVLVIGGDAQGIAVAAELSRLGCLVVTGNGGAALRHLEEEAPDHVVDLRALERQAEDAIQPAARALALYQALAARRPERVRLTVVTSHAQAVAPGERVDPARAALPGLLLSMAQEAAWLTVQQLDLDAGVPEEAARRVALELAAPRGDVEVAWRSGRRFVPVLERVDLASAAGLPLPRGAALVLGGGLSEVGIEVARELRRRCGAHVLLLGRATAPAADERLRSLAALPGTARYAVADVTEAEAVDAAVDLFEREVGAPVHAFLHLAGRYDEGALVSQNAESLWRTAHAKIAGALVLGERARRRGARFVAFSSLTGWWGGALVGAYAWANRWLDSYAAALAAEGADARSLAFSVWDGLGVSRRFAGHDALAAQGLEILRPARAAALTLAAMRTAPGGLGIGLDDTHPAVVRRTLGHGAGPVLTAWLPEGAAEPERETLQDALGRPMRVSFRRGVRRTEQEAQPQNELEAGLLAIWKDVLRLSNVTVLDNFFDLGGHSVLVFQVHRRLTDLIGREIPLVKLFQFPTIRSLAGFLAETAPGAPEAPAADRAAARREDVQRLRRRREIRDGAGS